MSIYDFFAKKGGVVKVLSGTSVDGMGVVKEGVIGCGQNVVMYWYMFDRGGVVNGSEDGWWWDMCCTSLGGHGSLFLLG